MRQRLLVFLAVAAVTAAGGFKGPFRRGLR
jgi:hypothetical protein